MLSSLTADSLFRKKAVNGALSFLCFTIEKKVTPEKIELTIPPINSAKNITVYAISNIKNIGYGNIYRFNHLKGIAL